MGLSKKLIEKYLGREKDAKDQVENLLKESYKTYYLKKLNDPASTNVRIRSITEINHKIKEALKKNNEEKDILQEEIKFLIGE